MKEQLLPIESSTNDTIQFAYGHLVVPSFPTIPVIPGDGIGPEIWDATRKVMDAAVTLAYKGTRKINWLTVQAGEAALESGNDPLPEVTLSTLRKYRVAIKGPLATPVGGGMRSINVALRRELDLYACMRPVKYYPGILSPLYHPENVDMVVFRENTEDIYAGVEFEAGSTQVKKLLDFMTGEFPVEYARIRFPESSALGIKPISKEGSIRLVRSALLWALKNRRKSVTLVHKGNIMKFTEGGFRQWGYDVAEQEFSGQVYTRRTWEVTAKNLGEDVANHERSEALESGKLWVTDIIADAMFEATLTHPEDFDVLATTNLNGDYLSDALAAEVGGLGIAPGANINFETCQALFEATHGTAPLLTGKGLANPTSLILSGEMLLRFIAWDEAADLVIQSVEQAFYQGQVTKDLSTATPGRTHLFTIQFADALIGLMKGNEHR